MCGIIQIHNSPLGWEVVSALYIENATGLARERQLAVTLK
jgi:hypothetical protein